MKRLFSLLSLGFFCLSSSDSCAAPTDGTNSVLVTFSVAASNQVSLSGPAPELVVSLDNNHVVHTTSTYSVNSNSRTSQNISATLDLELPPGVFLFAAMDAPSGGVSNGFMPLSTVPVALVSGVSGISAIGLGVAYQISVLPSAPEMSGVTRTITYTLGG